MLQDYLPDSLNEFVEVIGLVPTLALTTLYGGQDLNIPLQFPDDHLIVRVIGSDLAAKLSYHFGGGAIAIAKGKNLSRKERDAEIVRLRPTMTIQALARRFHLTERRIWGILAKERAKNQPIQHIGKS